MRIVGSSSTDLRTLRLAHKREIPVFRLLLLALAWFLVFDPVVAQLVQSAYHGESIGVLNQIIEGQHSYPVEHYLQVWTQRSLVILLALFALPLGFVIGDLAVTNGNAPTGGFRFGALNPRRAVATLAAALVANMSVVVMAADSPTLKSTLFSESGPVQLATLCMLFVGITAVGYISFRGRTDRVTPALFGFLLLCWLARELDVEFMNAITRPTAWAAFFSEASVSVRSVFVVLLCGVVASATMLIHRLRIPHAFFRSERWVIYATCTALLLIITQAIDLLLPRQVKLAPLFEFSDIITLVAFEEIGEFFATVTSLLMIISWREGE